MKRKLCSVLLALCMVLTLLPVSAMADETDTQAATSLPDAVDNVITLTEDVTLAENYVVPVGTTLTLDLSSYTLTGSVVNEGTLTIKGNGGKISANSWYTLVNRGTMYIGETGQSNNFSIESTATITAGKYNYSGPSLVQNGWDLSGGTQKGEGAPDKAQMTIYGGSFIGGLNSIKNDEDGLLTIENGNFTSAANAIIYNVSNGNGAVTATINGGTFTQNATPTTSRKTYGVYCAYGANTNIAGGKITMTSSASQATLFSVNNGSKIAVSAGEFSKAVGPQFCAEAYVPVKLESGSYSVAKNENNEYVASTSKGESFKTLQAALDTGANVTMLCDITESVTVTKSQYLYMDSHTLTGEAGKAAITVAMTSSTASLTLRDDSSKIVASEGQLALDVTKGYVSVSSNITFEGPVSLFVPKNYSLSYGTFKGNVNVMGSKILTIAQTVNLEKALTISTPVVIKGTVGEVILNAETATLTAQTGSSVAAVRSGIPGKDVKLDESGKYPVYSLIDVYTVIFDSAGGSEVSPQTVVPGSTVQKPDAPTKAGYTFIGWFDSDNQEWDFENGVVNANMTLTAQWSFIPVPVTPGSTSSTTTTNPDGSTTTTTTDKATGTVTETTKNTDGSTTTVETKKDGSVTETNKTANGSVGTIKSDANGSTEISASISAADVSAAEKKNEPVAAPVSVAPAASSASAPVIKLSVPSGAGEVSVVIPVTNAQQGTVAVKVNPDGTEEIIKTSVVTKDGVVLGVEGNVQIKIVNNDKDFVDTVGHWAESDVDFVSARELFTGTAPQTFSPEAATTRGMVVTVLARLAGENTDGGANWYDKGCAWAVANGVSDGADPNGTVTREQLAAMLYRYFGSPAVSGTLSFADASSVSEYAHDAMLWCVNNGIINGMDGLLNPQGQATRAQVSAMFARYIRLMATK